MGNCSRGCVPAGRVAGQLQALGSSFGLSKDGWGERKPHPAKSPVRAQGPPRLSQRATWPRAAQHCRAGRTSRLVGQAIAEGATFVSERDELFLFV